MELTKQNLQKMAKALQKTGWYKKASEYERRLIDYCAVGRGVVGRSGAKFIQRQYDAHCKQVETP